MGLNRNLLMGQNVDLKNIKAMMTVGQSSFYYGFKNGEFGSLSPNPLPNGVFVTKCYVSDFNTCTLEPLSIKSCTINNITFYNNEIYTGLAPYLKQNKGKTIPVIFHFD